ncbi:hypothetical protein CBER1_02949 [Cercospora berteroae]|uniref:F-box domain-containing protein n=1 Tax=Cercospora berteroae TaxID=357750 RepID=A0A2S6C2V0_9PEZI|nr:hypothetical protein CBER1_02949 [Cercospora berteroae]
MAGTSPKDITSTASPPQSDYNCHLLSLPAELRTQIYEEALSPTATLHLTSTKTKRHATLPILAPSLLATNHQINQECSSLLYSNNEICIIIDAHDTCWPIISETRLPQPVLEKLELVFLILDCTASFRADYEDVDFTALEALKSLKTLRLAVVFDRASGLGEIYGEFNPLTEILSRVPASTRILCGVGEDSAPARYLAEAVRKKKMPVTQWRNGNGNLRNTIEDRAISVIEKQTLEAAVAAVESDVRGTKLGAHRDVFSAYRADQGTVTFRSAV